MVAGLRGLVKRHGLALSLGVLGSARGLHEIPAQVHALATLPLAGAVLALRWPRGEVAVPARGCAARAALRAAKVREPQV